MLIKNTLNLSCGTHVRNVQKISSRIVSQKKGEHNI